MLAMEERNHNCTNLIHNGVEIFRATSIAFDKMQLEYMIQRRFASLQEMLASGVEFPWVTG